MEWRQPPARATCYWGSSTDEYGNRTSPLGLVPSQASFPRGGHFNRDVWQEKQRALRLEQMAQSRASLNPKDPRAGSVAIQFGRTSRGEFGFSSLSTLSNNSMNSGDFTHADKPWTPPGISRAQPMSALSSTRSLRSSWSRRDM